MALLPTTNLREHQKFAIKLLKRWQYVVLADEQGVGKTLEIIATFSELEEDFLVNKLLVVAPASLNLNWKDEFEKFTTYTDVKVGFKKAQVNIISYGSLSKAEKLFKEADMIAFDEAHYLMNEEAQRTKYAHKYLKDNDKNKYVYLLTGTPIKEKITDFYSLLKIMGYCKYGTNGKKIQDKYSTFNKFANNFTNVKTFQVPITLKKSGKKIKKTIVKYEGTKNEKELKSFLLYKYIRRTQDQVLDLPPMIIKSIPIKLKDSREEAEWAVFNENGKKNVESKVKSALMVVPHTIEYCKILLGGGTKPLIVFSDHKKPVAEIKKGLGKYKVASMDGDTDLKERNRLVKMFQSGKLDVLVLTYGVGSTGLTLTASSNMILNDYSWEVTTMSQAFKRFHRFGQTKRCIVHSMDGTKVNKRIITDVLKKEKDIKAFLE